MSTQPLTFGESVAEKIGDHRFVVGEGDEAVANVARGQNAEFFLKAPRRAAVIADRYDGGEIARAPFEAAQQRRKPRATADRHDLIALLKPPARQRIAKPCGLPAAGDSSDGAHPHEDADAHEYNAGGTKNPGEICGRKIIDDDAVENLVDVDPAALCDEPARDPVEQQNDAENGQQNPALDPDAGQQPLNRTNEALAH